MAHTNTYIDASLPFGLARVAAVTGNSKLDIGSQCREGAYINKWAKYKPQAVAKLLPITEDERKAAAYPYGLKMAEVSSVEELHVAAYEYAGVPGSGDIARLTDFAGYNHEAALDVSADITVEDTTLKITFTSNPTDGSLSFAEVVEALFGLQLSALYPVVVASRLDESGESIEASYMIVPKLNGESVATYTVGTFTADLSEIGSYVDERKWKVTVYFAKDDDNLPTDAWLSLDDEGGTGEGGEGGEGGGEEPETSYLTVEPSSHDFGEDVDGYVEVTVESSSAWNAIGVPDDMELATASSGSEIGTVVGDSGTEIGTVVADNSSFSGPAGTTKLILRRTSTDLSGTATITFKNEDGDEATLTVTREAVVNTYLTLSESTLDFGSSISQLSFTLDSSSAWKLKSSVSDFSVSPSSGDAGTTTVTVTCSISASTAGSKTLTFENEDGDEATITLTYEARNYITSSAVEITIIDSTLVVETVVISSSSAWTVSTNSNYISCTPTSGSAGQTTVTFNVLTINLEIRAIFTFTNTEGQSVQVQVYVYR